MNYEIRDDGNYIIKNGDIAEVYGASAPVITQSGGKVWTWDTSAPVITQSGGEVWTHNTSAPVIKKVKNKRKK